MLKEMGVDGVKIQEILELEDYMLATLPLVIRLQCILCVILTRHRQPVHAFIFLFRYRDAEMTQSETECSPDVWFANQIPDFACASVALLNIINNIKGLQMGKELRDFKDFTKDLDPMARGDAIDGFDFLKRIHNSFARETDLLNADMHLRNKMNKAKKRQAAAKAQETKKAKKEAGTPEKKRTDSAVATPTRASKRITKPTTKTKTVKTEVQDSDASSLLSEPPDSDPEFTSSNKAKKTPSSPPEQEPRRSGRKTKPRKDPTKLFSEAEAQPDEEGFHYVAYLPVNGRVWKLDGLDSYPHLVGEFDTSIGGEWMNVARPEIQARMINMEDGGIMYNLMAVVHDPIVPAKAQLAENVRQLQAIEAKLDAASKDWKEKMDAESNPEELVLGPSSRLALAETDLAAAPRPAMLEKEITAHESTYIDELMRLRKERVKAQAAMRASVRDSLSVAEADDERARLRRHDFGGFVKGWLGALADEEALKALVDEQQE